MTTRVSTDHHRADRARASRRSARAALGTALAVALVGSGAVLVPAQAAVVPPAGIVGMYSGIALRYNEAPKDVESHAVALLGLHAAGVTPDPRAVQWLLDQQCDNGGFMYYAGACTDTVGTVDTTALATQALLAVGENAAAADAAARVRALQRPDGGWTIGATSTALALGALDAAGLTPAVDPLPFLASEQAGRGAPADPPATAGRIGSEFNRPAESTAHSVLALRGNDLVDTGPRSFASWDTDPDLPTSPPPTDADGISRWGASWLATDFADDPRPMPDPSEYDPVANLQWTAQRTADRAWAVLALAATGTGRTAATDFYADVRTQALTVDATNPYLLGAAALAATVLGEDTDAQQYATLIAATLTTAAGHGTSVTRAYEPIDAEGWAGESYFFRNPYENTDLPMTQTILWGDGASTPLTGAFAKHTYALEGTFTPRVRVRFDGLRDAYVELGRITIDEPTVSIRLRDGYLWVDQNGVFDVERSGPAPTRAVVAWGDGTSSDALGQLFPRGWLRKTYTREGRFTPVLTITRGTQTRTASAQLPYVLADRIEPTVALTNPKSPTRVASWRTLNGTARDNGIGLRRVTVSLVQKRGKSWYSSNGTTWTKRASYAKAVAKAKRLIVVPTADGRWKRTVAKLTKGTLVVRYYATDRSENSSATRTKRVTLTRS